MPAYYLEALTVTLGFIILVAEAFVPTKNKSWAGFAGAIGLIAILVLTFFAVGPDAKPEADWAAWPLWNFYQMDSLARFYKLFALLATSLVLLMAIDYRGILSRYTDEPGNENGTGEFYSLPIFACAGMMWMASAKDLAGAFVALELVTITFYILVAFMRRNVGSLEAGVKYLILGALSTGFLVYGIAWIYGTTGTMSMELFPARIAGMENTVPLLFGIALVLVALGFKVGAVPMQMWIPDVYQGAPTPTTAFLSVGSKAAGFVLLLRFLAPFVGEASPVRSQVLTILLILAGATLLFGNLAAIAQSNFKRLLAYSSIAHAGFLILAIAAWTPTSESNISSVEAVSFYLATYLIMTLGVFFVVAQIRIHRNGESISDFNGLGKTHPTLALAMTVLLASLAGVPLTAGFIGKFFVFQLAAGAHLWIGLGIAVVAAAAGFYYYFKTIRAMWWIDAADDHVIKLPRITKFAVAAMTVLTLVFGVYPYPVLELLK
ncbi:NADH-quinone oxidoreductase subunit N [Luteolibacter algae]|uniref:NADH-quinone oxidoreductase subunit N n=1 Tax=Luteolibacter algae TaxID=454151 RepID=A0ABW5D8H1_9BACT